MYTSNDKLPKSEWKSVIASCRQSQGFLIKNLQPENDYTACVILKQEQSFGTENCDRIWLNKGIELCD